MRITLIHFNIKFKMKNDVKSTLNKIIKFKKNLKKVNF